jgi:hypothetical protein
MESRDWRSGPIATIRGAETMTDDIIHVEYDATLDDVVEAYVREARRSKMYELYPQPSLRSMISGGLVGGAVGWISVTVLLGRPVGAEVFVGAGLGGFVGLLGGLLYDRRMARHWRAGVATVYAARLPIRCELELRPACLWHRQEGDETTYDWTTVTAIVEKRKEVQIWVEEWPLLVKNSVFATPSDRDRFVKRARELARSAQLTT